MKPAPLEAVPRRYERERGAARQGAAPAKRLARVTGLIGLEVVFQIGGGKNRALASDAQLRGIGFHGKKPQQAWSGLPIASKWLF